MTAPFIREVVLENFMSYEYARIKLASGLNLVCGPNGSGKSSILLGISVALGQTYTERAKRLSDLIRWGSDIARITLIFDNSGEGRVRPFPSIRSSTLSLSRILRRDGTYSFYILGEEKSKSEVVELLSGVGLDPDNPFIIMHQGTIEEFVAMHPEEKLKLLEKAVGFEDYRRNILEARGKLSKVLSEEKLLRERMADAESTLEYWRREYEKLIQYRKLREREGELKLEFSWAKILDLEDKLVKLSNRVERYSRRISKLEKISSDARSKIVDVEGDFENVVFEEDRLFERIISSEKLLSTLLEDLRILDVYKGKLPVELEIEVKGKIANLRRVESDLKDMYRIYSGLRVRERDVFKRYAELRVEEALASSEIARLLEERKHIESRISELKSKIESMLSEVGGPSSKPSTVRGLAEIEDDLRSVEARIRALGSVSEDVASMYEKYRGIYDELKSKLEILSENKNLLLHELDERVKVWREALEKLLENVNEEFQAMLGEFGYIGYARLSNPYDIDRSGVEIYMGVPGMDPIPLNNLTQSGGERSLAVSTFLIALQQHVKSPFRALDEYDVHMDPANREAVFKHIVERLSGKQGIQYIVITPNPLPVAAEAANVIVVQKVGGRSKVGKIEAYVEA
ncbi:MAG: AAA family ATPase [Nitrososphaerota archaeon]|nr:AAA family ATPase [Candidatus Bathyarchaeota archaeon]MCX8162279.1 AAA family ATPase [Candidatus Bathyarchaeota archaeon]MDW8061148.1 AAA family ATPase [Nitrososphaerota archaeon]